MIFEKKFHCEVKNEDNNGLFSSFLRKVGGSDLNNSPMGLPSGQAGLPLPTISAGRPAVGMAGRRSEKSLGSVDTPFHLY